MPSPDEPRPIGNLARRGRPRTGERQHRRQAVLDAAVGELVDVGYEGLTMLGIARRAGASKETLYSWFGSKEGLLLALIEQEVTTAAERIGTALRQPGQPRTVLIEGAAALLERATSDAPVALRRAAITSAELGRHALALERQQVDPIIDGYMAQLTHLGPYLVADTGTAHRLFRSLVNGDLELQMLLGHETPTPTELRARATTGVERFLALSQT